MKRLLLCFITIFVLMACSNRNTIVGRWAMELDNSNEYSFKLGNDSVISPELRFDSDSIYLEIRTDGVVTKSENIGIYSIDKDYIRIVNRYGEERIEKYIIKENELLIVDKNNTKKILFCFKRIEEN